MRTELRAAAGLRPADRVWPHALRAGLAVGIPLVTLVAAGHTAWAATGLMFAFATAVSSAIPAQTSDLARDAALSAGAAALAWLISMAGVVVDPAAPRRLAIARALRAAAALAEVPSGPAGLRLRNQAAVAVEKAWRVVPLSRTDEALLVAHAETELAGVRGSKPDALRELAADLARKGPVPAFPASPAEPLDRRRRDRRRPGGRRTAGGPQLRAGSAPAADEADGRRLVLSLREAYEVASGEPGLSPRLTERVLHAERAARRKLAALTPVP